MSSERVLSVQNVSKTYRVYGRPHHRVLQAISDRRGRGPEHCFEVPAVTNVSFDLGRSDGISIIGRNGSGKSTLLEMITGTLQPSRGTIERHGRVSALLELGAGFNPDFTGRQNFRLAASIQGLTEDEIDSIEGEVEAFAEIGPFIDEPVRTYSSGMYVRLAFAAAVHVLPDLLVVDEALAVGDIFFQQKCFDFLEHRLADCAMVIVTHDLASAVRLSSRCIVMDQGEVVFDGPPLDAVETYTALSLRERSTRTGSRAAMTTPHPAQEPSLQLSNRHSIELPAGRPTDVPADRSSDAALMNIERIWLERRAAGGWTGLDGEAPIVHPGDVLRLTALSRVGIDVAEPVWGYLVRDRVGNALFGQNTLGSGLVVSPMSSGSSLIRLEFKWPEVEEGEYSVTLGLGNGLHPLHHDIIAWVQRALRLVCVPARPVHGSFNNDLLTAVVEPFGADVDPATVS
jgi:ABC-type polysaccharide/polyol phosphate transport system ATPase subunit